MPQHILREAGAEFKPSHTPQQLGGNPLHLRLIRRRFTGFEDGLFHALCHALHHLFDTSRMNASIRHKLFKRLSRDLAAHRIKTRDDNRFRRIVD